MLAFDYGPAGKPRLAGHDGPRFNISHSGTLAVIAVARVEVGIDVECRNAPVPDVPPGVFAAIEAREIQSADDPLVAFYDTWTRKEALVKAMGAGLGESIANLVVRRSGGVTIGGFHVQTLNVGEGYSAALAAECGGSESPPNIIIRSWTQTERWTLDSGCWSGSSP